MLQAPPEKRQVFAAELQRVGNEGAKVLRELGEKLKKMERLNPGDILLEVHEAAEELQMKIDQNSYLLVNSETWPPERQPKEPEDRQGLGEVKDDENKMVINSLNETSWDVVQNPNVGINNNPSITPEWMLSGSLLRQPVSWPRLSSFHGGSMLIQQESKVYESASSLSLATFTSLLIEFVARIQNLVDAFQELSEKANFKNPDEAKTLEVGFWTRRKRCFQFKT